MINEHRSRSPALLPTIVCSWCKQVLSVGTPKISHGICRSCAATFFGRKILGPVVLPA